MRVSKIDLNIVWDDAKAMGIANRDLLTAIAGMFLLLPFVVAFQLISLPPGQLDPKAGEEAIMAWYRTFFSMNWVALLGVTLFMSFGQLAMLALLLRHERLTVGEALKAALIVLPSYMVAYFLQNLALQLGMMLFILPALYLTGRFALIAAVAAAEQELNPLTIVLRSFTLTRGNGWRIFGILAIIVIAMSILFLVGTLLVGVAAELLLPSDLADLLMQIVAGLMLAAMMLVTALVSAALYRAAVQPVASPWRP